MRFQTWFAPVLAAALLAGCSAGSGTVPSSVTPGGDPGLSGSSAARHILANVTGTRAAAGHHAESGYDDGGFGQLQLPQLVACGDGIYSTNCSLWSYPFTTSPNAGARSAQTVVIGGGGGGSSGPPVLNFCAAQPSWAQFLADAGSNAAPVLHRLGPVNFSVRYLGTQTGPIVTFGTNPFVASLTGSFASGATAAQFTMTPSVTTSAGRGWLLFFTWSWPADILLIPYSVNEIQLAPYDASVALSSASPTAKLAALDCLGESIAAKTFGKGVTLGAPAATSLTGELLTTITGGSSPATIVLTDGAGASAAVPVNGGTTPSWGPDL